MSKEFIHLADDVKRALADMPVHMTQLTHMFRKHGAKTSRTRHAIDATDRQALNIARQVGWRGDSLTPNDVMDLGKGNRPNPNLYLDKDYIDAHMARFEGGATRFYNAENLEKYGPGNQGTTFVFPTAEVDDIIARADGDPKKLAAMLGLDEDFFVDKDGNAVDIVRADFSPEDVKSGELRMPSGNEGGAHNDYWIPGGYLPDGIPEAVININDFGDRGHFEHLDLFTPKA